MKVTHLTDPDIYWKCRIDLDEETWPPIDASDAWLHRPIYHWVHENCRPVNFSYYGMILFGSLEDAVQFQLTWS
jgi:hypothetical protein